MQNLNIKNPKSETSTLRSCVWWGGEGWTFVDATAAKGGSRIAVPEGSSGKLKKHMFSYYYKDQTSFWACINI